MQIIKLNISELKKYKNNAKLHPRSQIDHLKASIEKFGFNDPIGIWGDKNEIVEGHGRLEALKQLGYSEVECIRLDHLTDEERRAYMLAHNQTNIETGFDFDLLKFELDSILDIDMTAFGFLDDSENYNDDFSLPDEEKEPFCQITFTLANEQAELIKYSMGVAKDDIQETFGNENSNGNALYEVVRQWAEQRK